MPGKTHIKKWFFNGRTTKVLPSLHQWLSCPCHFFSFFSFIIAWNGCRQFSFSSQFMGLNSLILEKKVVFCLMVRGVYPPYTHSGPSPISLKTIYFFRHVNIFSMPWKTFFINHSSGLPPLSWVLVQRNIYKEKTEKIRLSWGWRGGGSEFKGHVP